MSEEKMVSNFEKITKIIFETCVVILIVSAISITIAGESSRHAFALEQQKIEIIR